MVDPETIKHEVCKMDEPSFQEPKSFKKCCGQFRKHGKCEVCGNIKNSVCHVPDCDCHADRSCQKRVNYYFDLLKKPLSERYK